MLFKWILGLSVKLPITIKKASGKGSLVRHGRLWLPEYNLEKIEGLFCSSSEGMPCWWTRLNTIIFIYREVDIFPVTYFSCYIFFLIGTEIPSIYLAQSEVGLKCNQPTRSNSRHLLLCFTIAVFLGHHIFLCFLAMMENICTACRTTFIMVTNFKQNGSDKENR